MEEEAMMRHYHMNKGNISEASTSKQHVEGACSSKNNDQRSSSSNLHGEAKNENAQPMPTPEETEVSPMDFIPMQLILNYEANYSFHFSIFYLLYLSYLCNNTGSFYCCRGRINHTCISTSTNEGFEKVYCVAIAICSV